ncbi:hypothetical protein NGR_b09870 (plasmid) [Sinorhizobium fredii NGR234]|uniref:PIN domain-containing protein n=1 Tax=Sinorhizobium fredii (strain NBRC 101917 / NGR234) TaxID=394 RepID=C3KQT2_SINFN|nr:hypothetical protein NGR_b09870 [Sinorhizobium fredii NGR234]
MSCRSLLTPAPSAAVEAWLAEQPPTAVFTTTVTEAEIFYGLRLLPDGRRRRDLEAAIVPIFREDLAGRILPFDSEAAHAYATLAADRRKTGRPVMSLRLILAPPGGAEIEERAASELTPPSPLHPPWTVQKVHYLHHDVIARSAGFSDFLKQNLPEGKPFGGDDRPINPAAPLRPPATSSRASRWRSLSGSRFASDPFDR